MLGTASCFMVLLHPFRKPKRMNTFIDYFNVYQSEITMINSLIEGISSLREHDNHIVHKHTDPAFKQWFRDCQKDNRYAVLVLLAELATKVRSAEDFANKILYDELPVQESGK